MRRFGDNDPNGWWRGSPSGPGATNPQDDTPRVAHAVPVRATVSPVLAMVLASVLLAGCSGSDSCTGQAYHPDLGTSGAETPIRALEAWLGTHGGITREPPDDGWAVQDTGEKDPQTVVITNEDGDGWWVSVARTDDGTYVVAQATDDASHCEGKLS